jgi:hypothetical protein
MEFMENFEEVRKNFVEFPEGWKIHRILIQFKNNFERRATRALAIGLLGDSRAEAGMLSISR